jgi:hypothetical protein
MAGKRYGFRAGLTTAFLEKRPFEKTFVHGAIRDGPSGMFYIRSIF